MATIIPSRAASQAPPDEPGLTLERVDELLRWRAEATGRVTKLARAMMRVNRCRMYRVHYAYQDSVGRSHTGTSAMMPEDEARRWGPDDTGSVRYDPHRRNTSIWVG